LQLYGAVSIKLPMPINRETMKRIFAGFNLAFAFAFMSLIVGCAHTQQTENYLSAAGFNVVIATTPAQQEHLRTLPAYKMMRIQRNGKDRYVYADPAHNQIFVGVCLPTIDIKTSVWLKILLKKMFRMPERTLRSQPVGMPGDRSRALSHQVRGSSL
jgi:hypothetical protein